MGSWAKSDVCTASRLRLSFVKLNITSLGLLCYHHRCITNHYLFVLIISLVLSLYIYIYIYTRIYTYIHTHISLSLYIYIHREREM